MRNLKSKYESTKRIQSFEYQIIKSKGFADFVLRISTGWGNSIGLLVLLEIGIIGVIPQ